jgi:hypothetical protein
MTNLGIVRLLKKEHDLLTKQIQGISAALSAFGAVYGEPNGAGRKMEGAGRTTNDVSLCPSQNRCCSKGAMG